MRTQLIAKTALTAASMVALERVLRPRYETWGASEPDILAELPGDEIVRHPNRTSTRAVTINAPPDAIWPWLAQMGHARSGLYSYDWLENLVGCQISSADRIVPEHQHLGVGDLVRMGPEGYPAFQVVEVRRPHHLVMVSVDIRSGLPTINATSDYGATWQWVVVPDDHGSRLISRQRLSYPMTQLPMWWLVQPVAFVMERKMLLGIKQRVSRRALQTCGR